MHYFIDGYNMLFRLKERSANLQSQRESIIYEINKKISIVKWDVSLVFDAAFQVGERSRTHFEALEILFTAEGETADEYILDTLKNISSPQHETIVTSDKTLAWRARHRLAHTESVEDFIVRLHRSYKNKLHQLKKEKLHPLQSSQPPPVLPPVSQASSTPFKGASLEDYYDYYMQVFEDKWQTLLKEEKISQTSLPAKKRQPKKPKKLQDPFKDTPLPDPTSTTEMERWAKIFEQRLFDPNAFSK